MTTGNLYIIVNTDRCTKWNRAILSLENTVLHVLSRLIDHWIVQCGINAFLLTHNDSQFVRNVLEGLKMFLLEKPLLIFEYHIPTDVHAECYGKTIFARWCQYVDEHQQDWDLRLQALNYAYNTQIHRTFGRTPFSLVHFRDQMDLPCSSHPRPCRLTPSLKLKASPLAFIPTIPNAAADKRLETSKQR